jgi:hypothetical protein
MSQKKSARIFLLLVIGLLLISSIGFVSSRYINRVTGESTTSSDPQAVWVGDPDNNQLDPWGRPIVTNTGTGGSGGGSGLTRLISTISQEIRLSYPLVKPLFDGLLGETKTADNLFARILLTLVLFALVYTALGKIDFFESQNIRILISLIVPILGIRYLQGNWIQAILLPYSAFGVAATSLIPLIIYFFVVEEGFRRSRTIRKGAWAFAAVVFIGLYFTRFYELQEAAWIYLIGAVICIGFMIWDKSIQRAISNSQNENLMSIHNDEQRTQILRDNHKLDQDLANNLVTPAQYRARKIVLRNRGAPFGLHIDVP